MISVDHDLRLMTPITRRRCQPPLRLTGVLFQFLERGLPDLLMLLMGSAQLVIGGVLERDQ